MEAILKEQYNCYVYHIIQEQDSLDLNSGYIGVSKYPEKRLEHHRNRSENPHLYNAFIKYGAAIKQYLIFQGTEQACYDLELKLRPVKNIGWNINCGGSKPPSPKGTSNCISNLPLEKRRKNYKHTEATLEKMAKQAARPEVRLAQSLAKLGSNNAFFEARGSKNPNFQGYYITPDGIFESTTEAAGYYKIDRNTIARRFGEKGLITIKPSRWHPKEYWGKSWYELGWKFIGKNEMNFEEISKNTGWKLPRVYSFSSLSNLKDIVENLPNLEEGVVLYDKGNPAVKLKSSVYIVCHRLRGEGLNPKRVAELVAMNETAEYLAIFPEDEPTFTPVIEKYNRTKESLTQLWNTFRSLENQKDFALAVKDYPGSGILFNARKTGVLNFDEKVMMNLLIGK